LKQQVHGLVFFILILINIGMFGINKNKLEDIGKIISFISACINIYLIYNLNWNTFFWINFFSVYIVLFPFIWKSPRNYDIKYMSISLKILMIACSYAITFGCYGLIYWINTFK